MPKMAETERKKSSANQIYSQNRQLSLSSPLTYALPDPCFHVQRTVQEKTGFLLFSLFHWRSFVKTKGGHGLPDFANFALNEQ